MKKLLVLMLVVGMTSWASAMIVSPIEINNTGAVTIADVSIDLRSGMSSAVDGSGGYWAFISSSTPWIPTPDAANPVDPTSGAITSLAPDASGILGDAGDTGVLPYGVGVFGFFGSYSATWSTGAGAYADSFTGTARFLSLYLIDDTFATAIHVMTTPEPMTIVLLGLGGLIMLRRRK